MFDLVCWKEWGSKPEWHFGTEFGNEFGLEAGIDVVLIDSGHENEFW